MSIFWLNFDWWAALDIFIISFFLYKVFTLIRGTRSAQMLTGIFFLTLAYTVSKHTPLTAIHWVLNKFYSSIVLIFIILFQEDIRLFLRRLGKKTQISRNDNNFLIESEISEISKACFALTKKKIGALIVIEQNILLTRYMNLGIQIDALISKEVLLSFFHPSSPVHDGAVIIQNGRISWVGCFLPLSRTEELDKDYGTRHRAAIGITQLTDALVLVVSEERQEVSMVIDGSLKKVQSIDALTSKLKGFYYSHKLSPSSAMFSTPGGN